MIDRLHVYIEGRVQGVGFRYSTLEEAARLGLAGWVKNLDDGRVEAEFEGPRPTLEALLVWCHHGPRGAWVSAVEASWEMVEPAYQGIHLRH